MNISKFLSKVIGIYEIILSLAMFMNMKQFTASIQSLISDEPLMLYIGCVTVIMGILMVLGHNIWQWSWRVLVTIVSWIVFLKGASILLFPHFLDQLTIQFISNPNFSYSVAVLDFILGVLFCYFGFRRGV